MRDKLTARDRRLANRLTTLTLALQMLDRKTELSAHQRGLVRAAHEAADDVTAELLARQAGWDGSTRPSDGAAARALASIGDDGSEASRPSSR